jgi:hypothetical protein
VRLGATIERSTHTLPLPYISAFDSQGGTFVVGNSEGLVIESSHFAQGASDALDRGRVRSVTGSASGWAAASLANGTVALIDVTGSAPVVRAFVPYSSAELQLGGGGASLVARSNPEPAAGTSLMWFTLPEAQLGHEWTYAYDSLPALVGFTYSQSDSSLGLVLRTGSFTTTRIYVDGQLVDATNGWAVGWVDNERVLVNRYDWNGPGGERFLGAYLVAPGGAATLTNFLALANVVAIGDGLVYSARENAIYDPDEARPRWSGSAPRRPGQ